jgi:hypothetical protein
MKSAAAIAAASMILQLRVAERKAFPNITRDMA